MKRVADRIPAVEWVVLTEVGLLHGVDPLFLAAIRLQESGQPGGAFGEMGVPTYLAPTFKGQVAVAAKTVRNRLVKYEGNPLVAAANAQSILRIRYSEGFIRWFAGIWAPVGAANDPRGLNAHWPINVLGLYDLLVKESF